MTHYESDTLQLLARTLHHRLFRISFFRTQQQSIEHGRNTGLNTAETSALGLSCVAVRIGPCFEITPHNRIERIRAPITVDLILQIVPRTTTRVERTAVLRSHIRIVGNLLVHTACSGTFIVTDHMPFVVGTFNRFIFRLNTRRDDRIRTVIPISVGSLVTTVHRPRNPNRAMVLCTVTNRDITCPMSVYRKIGTNMVCIVVVAVLHLHRQLGPAGTIDVFRGGDCSALGGESTLLAPILLAADRGVQVERIGGRGAQSGDGRTLISRRSRHRFRGVIRFTGGFVSKSYFDADRFFAFIGEAARQGGRRSGHIRRSDGTELRLGIFTRFQGRELCDGARITLVADNDIRIKIVFRFGFESVQLISQGRSRRSSLHLGIFLLRTGLIPEAGFRNIAVAFVLINAGKRRSGRRNPGRRRRFELRSSRLLALLQRGENNPFAGVILSVDYQIGIELVSRFRRQLLQTGRQRRVVRRNLYHSISRLGRCRRLVSETGFGNIGRITGV